MLDWGYYECGSVSGSTQMGNIGLSCADEVELVRVTLEKTQECLDDGMNANLKQTIRRIVGAILHDAGSVVHVGKTVREVYDLLTAEQKPKLEAFTKLVFRYLEALRRVQNWKQVHQGYTEILRVTAPFQTQIQELAENNEFPISAKEEIRLRSRWKSIYNDIEAKIETIVETRSPGDFGTVKHELFEEIRDFSDLAEVLFQIDTVVVDAIESQRKEDKPGESLQNALFDFEGAVKRFLDLANESMVEYLDCIKSDLDKLMGSLEPIVK